MGQLEASPLLGDRPGESALLVPEQLALDQPRRDGRAIELDHGLVAAGTLVVDGPTDQLFAGARAAVDEHGAVRRRYQLGLAQRLLERRAGAHDLLVVVLGLDLVVEHLAGPLPLGQITHQRDDAGAAADRHG